MDEMEKKNIKEAISQLLRWLQQHMISVRFNQVIDFSKERLRLNIESQVHEFTWDKFAFKNSLSQQETDEGPPGRVKGERRRGERRRSQEPEF